MPRLQLPVRSMSAVASSSFATHARTFAFLALSARTLLRMRRSTTDRTVYLVNQHILLHSRARFSASGLCLFASLTPHRGVGGAPRDVRVLGGTPVGVHVTRHARRLRGALRPMTRDARLSALHRGGFRLPGPRFSVTSCRLGLRFSGHPDPSQRAPRSQVVVPDGRGPGPPGASGYKPPPRDATPRSAFRMSPDDAPQRARMQPCIMDAMCSQLLYASTARPSLGQGGNEHQSALANVLKRSVSSRPMAVTNRRRRRDSSRPPHSASA